jgi:predicted component of type VI protein secretion system
MNLTPEQRVKLAAIQRDVDALFRGVDPSAPLEDIPPAVARRYRELVQQLTEVTRHPNLDRLLQRRWGNRPNAA